MAAAVLERVESQACAVDVLDEGVTPRPRHPAGYEAACADFADRSLPSPGECLELMNDLGVEERVIRHGDRVAKVGCRIVRTLVGAGVLLDLGLRADRGDAARPRQGKARPRRGGPRLLEGLGFPRVAEVVRAHTDLPPGRRNRLDESAVVYLADKLVKGDRVVSLHDRFQGASRRCSGSTAAQAALARRLEDAESVAAMLEEVLGAGALDRLTSQLAGRRRTGVHP